MKTRLTKTTIESEMETDMPAAVAFPHSPIRRRDATTSAK